MKVTFHTNIDAYKTNCFPTNLTTPPRIGEKVVVTQSFWEYYEKKKLPIRLEVVEVNWSEEGVVCALWYNKLDKELADKLGAKTL